MAIQKTSNSWMYYVGIVILIIILIFLLSVLMKRDPVHESFMNEYANGGTNGGVSPSTINLEDNEEHENISQASSLTDAELLAKKDCFPKDQLTAEDLLPLDTNSVWAQVNPVGQGELKDKNFLEAGYHIGINSVGQTKRNPNYQIRSEPPNPQIKVSPWMQSTIDPDTNRRPLEIGA
jgi:hypothetical protein